MTANTTEQLERTIMSYQKRVRELSEQLESWERLAQEGHPTPCTLGSLCPYCEIARLKAWKKEMLTVESWWEDVRSFVRQMPQCGIGKSVAKECLRILKESVEVREALDEFFDVHQNCGIDEVPHGYRHAVDRVKAILNSK